MRRRPQADLDPAIPHRLHFAKSESSVLGIVLSGGGVRAAYQVGALRAVSQCLPNELDKTAVVVGSSIGAVNGLIFGACLIGGADHAIDVLANTWRERTFSNTFLGSPSRAFIRSVRAAMAQFMDPGPRGSGISIFDPAPLVSEVDQIIKSHGGLSPKVRAPTLKAVCVMTTVEGKARKPLLFLSSQVHIGEEEMRGASFELCYEDNLTAAHGFGSAALPSVLPPVDLVAGEAKVRVVDGGISQNVPVDPAVRLGCNKIILVDVSGRSWWHDKYGQAHDHRPTWEVPSANDTFCLRPPETLTFRCQKALGPILKNTAGASRKRFAAAVGPIWPLFQLVRAKLGDEAAYEVMSYVAMDGEYLNALMETGYHETMDMLRKLKV